ncbi:thiamine biosynthesis protein X [Corynebacterium macginleyi]|uniref:thiamine biosynthesis protein X n=1 Tax=Corynebacterium macginleyi TaxID=38290 RepID=UPI00190D4421|nr:thiamine biosynthesis protein X [Corynebacterium macginleyi]MBK4144760.1 thiamine biosynthesis protein X [Corynebacterium macginleyi]
MKKFSRFAIAGLVITAGLSLAACHPPNEQDSKSGKIDNASTFTGEAPSHGTAESSSAATTNEYEVDTESLHDGVEEPEQLPNIIVTQLPH